MGRALAAGPSRPCSPPALAYHRRSVPPTGDDQEYGACDDVGSHYGIENAVPIAPVPTVTPTTARLQLKLLCASTDQRIPRQLFNGGTMPNDCRNPILGIDTRDGGDGILVAWPTGIWTSASGRISGWRRASAWSSRASLPMSLTTTSGPITSLGLYNSGGFGALGALGEGDRHIELGARVRF